MTTTKRHLTLVQTPREWTPGDRQLWPTLDARCTEHPAYEADYCPVCGTARVIGSDQ